MTLLKEPTVSVVIPVLNGERFVGEAIESVLKQTYKNIDLLVIDDGSSDNTCAVVREVLARFPDRRSELISRENKGVCRTLNEGFVKSRGEYFSYIGHDDIWEPEKVQLQIEILESTGFAAAYSDCLIIDEAGQLRGKYSDQYSYRGGEIYEDIVWMRFQPASPTVLFRRSAVQAVGGFNESQIWEDRDLWLRISRNNSVAYIDLPLARYRVHSNNGSTSNVANMHKYSLQVLDATLERDPSLEKYRTRLESKIDGFLASSYFESLELSKARKASLRAIKRYPFNYLAFRTFFLSFLGKSAISRLRSWRRSSIHE